MNRMYRLLRVFFSFLDCLSPCCSFPSSIPSPPPHWGSWGGLVGRPPVFGLLPNEDLPFVALDTAVCFLRPLLPLFCCSSLVSVPFSPRAVTWGRVLGHVITTCWLTSLAFLRLVLLQPFLPPPMHTTKSKWAGRAYRVVGIWPTVIASVSWATSPGPPLLRTPLWKSRRDNSKVLFCERFQVLYVLDVRIASGRGRQIFIVLRPSRHESLSYFDDVINFCFGIDLRRYASYIHRRQRRVLSIMRYFCTKKVYTIILYAVKKCDVFSFYN